MLVQYKLLTLKVQIWFLYKTSKICQSLVKFEECPPKSLSHPPSKMYLHYTMVIILVCIFYQHRNFFLTSKTSFHNVISQNHRTEGSITDIQLTCLADSLVLQTMINLVWLECSICISLPKQIISVTPCIQHCTKFLTSIVVNLSTDCGRVSLSGLTSHWHCSIVHVTHSYKNI